MADRSTPTFDLAAVQALVAAGDWTATWDAVAHAVGLELDAEADIRACVLALDEGDFYKTMESKTKPGSWQDVYKPRYQDIPIYLKVCISDSPKSAVVIQFKRDQSI